MHGVSSPYKHTHTHSSLDMEEQFTINRSRMAEITIAEDLTGGVGGAPDPFSEFGEFGDEFGGGMEDIERARKAVTFEEEKDKTDRTSLQVCRYHTHTPQSKKFW